MRAPNLTLQCTSGERAVAPNALACYHGVVKLNGQPFARKHKHTHIVSASSTRGWGAGLGRCSECRAVRC